MRRLPVLAVLAAVAALPAPAPASVGVVPYAAVTPGATCLRPTGAPGRLALADGADVALVSASPDGLTVERAARLAGHPIGCPAVAERGGAAVVAQLARVGTGKVVRAAVRDGGGTFGPPATVARMAGDPSNADVAVAIAPDGAAVIAIRESAPPTIFPRFSNRRRLLAARRAPGGSVGPAEIVAPWRSGSSVDAADSVLAGIDDAGTATVGALLPASGSNSSVLTTATGQPGGAFSAPAALGPADDAALVVAPDGRALIAGATPAGGSVREREPGAASFGPASTLVKDESPAEPAAAIAPDGSAVVAWRAFGDPRAGVVLATRAGPGPFGPLRRVGSQAASGGTTIGIFSSDGVSDQHGGDVRAVAGPDGRFVLSWGVADDALGGALRARALAGDLATQPGDAISAPALVRAASSIAPVAAPLGVAWADGTGPVIARTALSYGDARVHAALEDAKDVAGGPPPRLTVPVPAVQRRYAANGTADLTVRCAGACDVSLIATKGPLVPVGDVRSRRTAGPVTLHLPLSSLALLERTGPVRLRATVAVSAPASSDIARRSVTLPLRLRRPPRPPRAFAVRATRDGRDVVVTLRLRGGTSALRAIAEVRPRPHGDPISAAGAEVHGRHRLRVRAPYASRGRYVVVTTFNPQGGQATSAPVRIRG